MYTYKITDSKTIHSIANDSYLTEITIDVFKNDVFFDKKIFGYSLGTSKEDIISDLEKVMNTLATDEVIALQSAELDKQLTDAELLNKSFLNNK